MRAALFFRGEPSSQPAESYRPAVSAGQISLGPIAGKYFAASQHPQLYLLSPKREAGTVIVFRAAVFAYDDVAASNRARPGAVAPVAGLSTCRHMVGGLGLRCVSRNGRSHLCDPSR